MEDEAKGKNMEHLEVEADNTKDKIEEDCDRDFFTTPEEAVDYGIIDEVVETKTSSIQKPPMPTL